MYTASKTNCIEGPIEQTNGHGYIILIMRKVTHN